jgi:protein-S-isoprenylcysteine O-methyltransferase Ste14
LLNAWRTVGASYLRRLIEERDLIARFGDEYRRYRRQVPMLLPRLRLGQVAEERR